MIVLMPKYSIGRKITAGAEGVLVGAVETGGARRQVVIKERHATTLQAAEGSERERVALLELGVHDNIVNLLEYVQFNQWHYLVLERMHCDLYDLITSSDPRSGEQYGIPECQAVRVLRDITRGLRYMHGQQYTHNDIKPENILLSLESPTRVRQAKLTDFGYSTRHRDASMLLDTGHGTDRYMAPEVRSCYFSQSLSPKPKYDAAAADIFSLGCTLFVALVGQFWPHSRTLSGAQMLNARPLSAEIRDLTLNMVAEKPSDRPTIRNIRLSNAETIDYSLLDLFAIEEADPHNKLCTEEKKVADEEELTSIMWSSPLKLNNTHGAPCPSPVFDTEGSPVAK